jgi:OOP family OmpA-OmpF porin
MQPPNRPLRDAGMLAALLIMLAAPACPALAQATATAPAENLVDQLTGPDTGPEIEGAAVRQQALERMKSKATAQPLNRPPLLPELLKPPQISIEVLFDPDSSIIRPGSYGTLGRIADTLTNPALLPYKFLIVGHTESGGRRDYNLTVSQRRADAIRDVLVTTFKVSPKRLQSLGLGEEQLKDAARPTAAVNRRIQVVADGKMPEPSESPAAPPAKKPPPPVKKQPSRR